MSADGPALLAAAVRAACLAKAPRRTVQAVAAAVAGVLVRPATSGDAPSVVNAGRVRSEFSHGRNPGGSDTSPEVLLEKLRAARREQRQRKKNNRRAAKAQAAAANASSQNEANEAEATHDVAQTERVGGLSSAGRGEDQAPSTPPRTRSRDPNDGTATSSPPHKSHRGPSNSMRGGSLSPRGQDDAQSLNSGQDDQDVESQDSSDDSARSIPVVPHPYDDEWMEPAIQHAASRATYAASSSVSPPYSSASPRRRGRGRQRWKG